MSPGVAWVTHDGKVVCFGTDPNGTIWYTVKHREFKSSARSCFLSGQQLLCVHRNHKSGLGGA